MRGSALALPASFSFKIPTPAQGGNSPASVKAKSQLRQQGEDTGYRVLSTEYNGYNGYRVGTQREHPAQGDGRRLRVALLVGIADFNAFHGFKGLPSATGERGGKGEQDTCRKHMAAR